MRTRFAMLSGLTAALAVGTSCASLSQDEWWIDQLVPDSPCYRVNLLDGVDEGSTTELHDLFDCVDQNGLIAPLQPLDADLEVDTRLGDPIGIELARVLNHLPEVDVDPFAITDVLLEAMNAPDRPVEEILGLATELIWGARAAEVVAGTTAADDAAAIEAGMLAPLRPVAPIAASALLADGTGAVVFAGDVLADPETEEWILTVTSVLESELPEIATPIDPLLVDLGSLIEASRSPEDDRWEGASGDSLRDVADFFVVRDNPVVDEISPAVADMLGDPVVLEALVPMIDDLAAGNHLVPLPPEVGWLASVDTDGSPLADGEVSSLYRFVRLLAENNHAIDCRIPIPLLPDIVWRLPNLSVEVLSLIADMTPGEVQELSSIITSLTGNVISDLVFETALDTCPNISPTAYDDLEVLETLQMPQTENALTGFIAFLDVIKRGERDHIPAFADMAQALYEAGGLEPGEELIRDIAREPALTDVLTVLPVLVHPEEHGITAGGAPANDLDDLLWIVQWFFVVDPQTAMTGFQRTRPWMAPVLGEDGTWVAVGNLAATLRDPETELADALHLVPRLVELDPELVLIDQVAIVLHDDLLSLPLLRMAERTELADDLFASVPAPDATAEVPLAFGGRLIVTGALEDLLGLVDLILGSVSTTPATPTASTGP